MTKTWLWLFAGVFAALGLGAGVADKMTVPAYDSAGNVIRPEGYRKWVFVGTSLGLRYMGEGGSDEGRGSFHNVYIQPEAYDAFLKAGTFPEKTILAMEVYSAGTKEPKSGLTGGYYGDRLTGFSAAIKDKERFPEGWGYVSFMRDGSNLLAKAEPFRKSQCFDCHATHAATDNVFTQFYPLLRR
jgi:Cytochrome P460